MKFDILFEDTHLVVVSKPSGLLSQGDHSGTESLVDLLRTHFGRHYVGMIHRLDRNTSGLIIVAKRSKAADRLSESLRKGSLKRAYLAVLHGSIRKAETWKDFVLKNEATNTVSVVAENRKDAKEAVLHCQPLSTSDACGKAVKSNPNVTLVRFELETGRSHQIRVQCASRGHAIVGDVKYGAPSSSSLASAANRPLLHSAFLQFDHPMSHETMTFEVAPPEDFEVALGYLPETSRINPFK